MLESLQSRPMLGRTDGRTAFIFSRPQCDAKGGNKNIWGICQGDKISSHKLTNQKFTPRGCHTIYNKLGNPTSCS